MEKFFKENLIYLRELKGETQIETSKLLGISRSTYANYESGANFPKTDILAKIIGHFNTSFGELMSENLLYINEDKSLDEEKKIKERKKKPKDLCGGEVDNVAYSLLITSMQKTIDSQEDNINTLKKLIDVQRLEIERLSVKLEKLKKESQSVKSKPKDNEGEYEAPQAV